MSSELNEIWGLYADESEQSLEAMEEALLILRDTPTDADTISGLFRAMHTFKGNSRVMGLSVIESRAHVAEDLVGLVRDEGMPLDAELIDLLLEMVDILHPMLSQICETQQDATPEMSNDLVERMKDKLARCRNFPLERTSKKSRKKTPPVDETTPFIEENALTTTKAVDDIAPIDAIIFDNTETLANDPVYREIFSDMANDIFQNMENILEEFKTDIAQAPIHFLEACLSLQLAVEQIKLPEWKSVIETFLAQSNPNEVQVKTLYHRLLDLFNRDFGGEETLVEEPVLAMIFDKAESLVDDPVYLELFASMADDILSEMQNILKEFAESPVLLQSHFSEVVTRLLFAAKQIGLVEWQTLLGQFLAIVSPTTEHAQNLVEQLIVLFENPNAVLHANNDIKSDDPIIHFLAEIQKPLHVFAVFERRDTSANININVDTEELIQAAQEIKALAEEQGFFHLVEIVEDFLTVLQKGDAIEDTVHHFEFRLYETLVAIENILPEYNKPANFCAKTFLEKWCVDGVFESLISIIQLLEHIKNELDINKNCLRITELLREVHYACQHYKLDTAAHLCTSLSDLFARVLNDIMKPDAVMLHIAKSFITDMELIFESVTSGSSPDMALIEKLLQEASSAVFTSTGTNSSQSIEARLGLPKSFHKVLTTESVRIASESLKKGDHFYIVRANLEQDENLACNFLSWIESGVVQAISNVTVFDENRTLFDFLLASSLTATQIEEALAILDSTGMLLSVERTLADRKSNELNDAADITGDELFLHDADIPIAAQQGQLSGNKLESIGELVTHQTMVQHLLDELIKDDLIKTIEAKMNNAQGQWLLAKDDIRLSLLLWQEKIEKMAQISVQTDVLLTQLQEEAISGRMRSVGQLLKPLVPFVEALARKNNRYVDFKIVEGHDVSLDMTLLENLKSPLRALIGFCILQSIRSPEHRAAAGKDGRGSLRVALVENEDHIQISIEDDGIGIDLDRVAQRAKQLGLHHEKTSLDMIFHKEYGITANDDSMYGGLAFSDTKEYLNSLGGSLFVTNLPMGGVRFTLTMSLTMLLLDGMVVRVNAVQYIIPIDRIQRIVHTDNEGLMRVSANEGRYMLKLEEDHVIPIKFLKGSHQETVPTEQHLTNDEKHLFVIVVGSKQQCIAIKVNELIGQYNILSRPLQGYLSNIRGVIGCTLLGSGEVGLILDINALFPSML